MTENNFSKNRRRDALFYVLFGILLAFFIYQDVQWLVKYRFDQSLDIDESGYLALAIAFARAEMGGHWAGWWHAVSAPLTFAPMAPVVASLAMIGFGVNENYGFLCNVAFCAGSLILMFVALRRLSLAHALLASALLGCLPGFVIFSRSFQFVAATTFFYFAAFVFFVLSDGYRRTLYAVLVGVALGGMVLSRTMALAFLPAFAFAFVVYLFLVHGLSRIVFRNIVLSIIAFAMVAGPWYVRNFQSVFGYLFSFGYGAHAAEYGHSQGIFTIANLTLRVEMIFVQMRLPHFVIIVPTFFAALLFSLFGKRRDKTDSLILATCILCLSCFMTLWTSQNMGTGFDAPIYTVMIFAAAAWLGRINRRWIQLVFGTLTLATFSLASYAHQDLYRCSEMPKVFIQGIAGFRPLVDCGSLVHISLKQNGFAPENEPNFILSRGDAVAWRDLNRHISGYLAQEDANRSPVLLLSRHMIANVNSIGLEMIKKYGFNLPMIQIDPGMLTPTQQSYSRWLADAPQDSACLALMLNEQQGEFFPRADPAAMSSALESSNFQRAGEFDTPRPGQHFTIWRRNVAACRTGASQQ